MSYSKFAHPAIFLLALTQMHHMPVVIKVLITIIANAIKNSIWSNATMPILAFAALMAVFIRKNISV
ncbi:hypothetical protein KKG29_00890 [Patescibacteria group bacterium]|nr:hypothetical protein [Patescibacteria group bacterium]MBU3999721.1 hypothetical protein [Patescibacteria group bacterium]MBU4056686.1 hypothetical protein [Patescibacteria group bacterium]